MVNGKKTLLHRFNNMIFINPFLKVQQLEIFYLLVGLPLQPLHLEPPGLLLLGLLHLLHLLHRMLLHLLNIGLVKEIALRDRILVHMLMNDKLRERAR
jgi:hypothetical protein